MMKFYLIMINLLTFALFVLDKWLSRRRRVKYRIPENRLLLASAIGGSVGALLAMQVTRHKTRNVKFKLGIPLILLAQGAVIAFAARQLVD
ncbi:MAG: DUF1294 domain-containing protein [Desulfotomaculum sp.]|nr:DUF1294 domain-containing protein [Desulfotomaculum sp.]